MPRPTYRRPGGSTGSTALGGALSGAATGAAAGSFFPGPGTAIGAGIGGIVGGVGGWLKGRSQKRGAKEEQELFNAWMAQRGQAGRDVIGAAGGIEGLLGPQTSREFGSGTSFANIDERTRTRQQIDPTFRGAEGTRQGLLARAQGRVDDSNLASIGQRNRDLARINRFFDPGVTGGIPGGINTQGSRAIADASRRMALADRAGQFETESLQNQLAREQELGGVLDRFFRGETTARDSRLRGIRTGGETFQRSRTDPVNPATLAAIRDLLTGEAPMAGRETGISPFGDFLAHAGPGLGILADEYRLSRQKRKRDQPTGLTAYEQEHGS